MDSEKRKDVIGIENMAQTYSFIASDLLKYLNDKWISASYEDRNSVYGSSLKITIKYLEDSLKNLDKVAGGAMRVELEGARI